jgi:hypothetical protein
MLLVQAVRKGVHLPLLPGRRSLGRWIALLTHYSTIAPHALAHPSPRLTGGPTSATRVCFHLGLIELNDGATGGRQHLDLLFSGLRRNLITGNAYEERVRYPRTHLSFDGLRDLTPDSERLFDRRSRG